MPWTRLLEDQPRLFVEPLQDWFASLLLACPTAGPFELAVLGGCRAATPGLAFLAGYQGALRVLWPSAPASLGALCVTENKSTRPADMRTRLDGLRLNGRKDFVTAGDAADWLLVAAREEPAGEAPRLALAVLRAGAPGIEVENLPALPLMLDIGHARLHLRDAQCERLAGDGWDAYVKPFRSIEDLHVLAALTAWHYGLGRECGWPQALQLRLLALLAGCAEVARQDPSAAATHLLLAGLFAQQQTLKPELEAAFAGGPPHWARLWQRDQHLLTVAAAARAKRLQKALATLGIDAGQ
ncbi:acyl-CoA dehydrogenase family protein [Pseudomonas sp. N040]|uniref:acyl-CoA dehydrogenase family protein n=1 Tax=Pseudomonas sp. N040 TaxID=2785325 RepID=UPI0018A2F96B|nr:acyl-CoA dehydrogenase family protein [Pseudomonas sp. N040]MBF7730421.1 acyl-CoA dehydrogenase family protein [Pseudomonas sp. N040]MBW7014064.1 acyl-CoA dehydrogenase [Pseudomonas sp. N040]